MAEKKKQDEKLILGLGVVAALGLIAWAVLGFISLPEKFNEVSSVRKDLKGLQAEEELEIASQLLNNPPMWLNSEIKGRPLEMMTPIPLFLIPGDPYLIDLYNEEGKPIHPPVPNKWWLKHKIDPSYKNSLIRDFDKDGFNNLEEFEAKTNPADSKDYPDLISKLSVADHSVMKWKVFFSSDIGEDQYQFRYENSNKVRLRSQYIGRGARFFDREPVVSRYIVKDVVEKEEKKNGMTQQLKYVVIEDTLKDTKIEIPKGKNNDYLGKDYSVTFVLNALGKDSAPFTLPENSRFDLPEGTVNPEGKFHFVGVDADQNVIIRYLVGEEITELTLPL